MKSKTKKLIICVAIPLVVGGVSAIITRNSMDIFEMLNKPALAPPGYLFPIVWTLLYIMMGIASYLVLTSDNMKGYIDNALAVYAVQLAVNFLWPIFFFSFGWYLLSFFWVLLLLLLIILTTKAFYKISKPAAYLMLPYLLWVTFAAYLNLSIFFLN